MAVKNEIIAGDYKGFIDYANKKKGLYIYGAFGLGQKHYINKDTVDHYEIVDEEEQKSMVSGVVRGAVGAAVFGGVGAIAGAASAKSKKTYKVSIFFKDGKKCLCLLDHIMFEYLEEIMY